MPLSDTAIRNAKPGEKPYKLADEGGLHLYVTPQGSKLWRLKYRFEGREKLLSFGAYPVTSLKKARVKRDEAKAILLDGRDPGDAKKAERRAAASERANSFEALAGEYRAKLVKEGRAEATLKKFDWLMDAAFPRLGARPIREIEPPDVLAVLRDIESAGKYETAKKLRTNIGAIFRFAIATGRATNDPTEALKGALITPKVASRAALTDRKGLGRLLRTIDSFDGMPTTRTGLQLLALLAPRPGELRNAHWEEFDLDEAVWRIPPERMKMRRPHRVPLPPQALEHLRELHRLTGTGELVFPSSSNWKRPISENTLNGALRRMGFDKTEMTSHGFRASFSTLANESGLWNPDAIERALGHIEASDVRRAYARGEHWDERVRMAAWWADELDAMRGADDG